MHADNTVWSARTAASALSSTRAARLNLDAVAVATRVALPEILLREGHPVFDGESVAIL